MKNRVSGISELPDSEKIDPDYADPKTITALKEIRLTAVLSSLRRSPFWQTRYGLAQQPDRTSLEELRQVPLTYKSDLRQQTHLDHIIVPQNEVIFYFSSSGTTGDPTVYTWSNGDDEVLNIAVQRAMQRVNMTKDDTVLMIAPMGLPIMWYCMMKQAQQTGAALLPVGLTSPDRIVSLLERFPVTIMISVPGTFLALQEYCLLNNLTISRKLKHLQCGGSYLTTAVRTRLESYFTCPVYDFYGLSELFGPIAGECEQQDGMHLLHDYLILELMNVDGEQTLTEPQSGVAVFTPLWHKSTPFLRYWSDDFLALDTAPCSCGRTSPRIKFLGRVADMTILNGKRIFGGDIENLLLKHEAVGSEFCCEILESATKVRARVSIEEFPQREAPVTTIAEELEDLLGMECHINVVPVGLLPRSNKKPCRIVKTRA